MKRSGAIEPSHHKIIRDPRASVLKSWLTKTGWPTLAAYKARPVPDTVSQSFGAATY